MSRVLYPRLPVAFLAADLIASDRTVILSSFFFNYKLVDVLRGLK